MQSNNTVEKKTSKKSTVKDKVEDKVKDKVNDKVNEEAVVSSGTDGVESTESAEHAAERSQDKYQTTEEKKERPTRSRRFFIGMDKFGDLFYLNILFILTSIPIITIGASFTALYTVTNKMVDDDEPPVKDCYFKAFKENFKQATILWIIDLIIFYLMYLQYQYVIMYQTDAAKMLFVALGFEFIFMAFAVPLQFPLVARYENTTFNLMRNALVFSVAYLGTWFRVFFTWGFLFILYFLNTRIFIYTWYLWILILAALFAYVCSMIFIKFYDKLEKPKE